MGAARRPTRPVRPTWTAPGPPGHRSPDRWPPAPSGTHPLPPAPHRHPRPTSRTGTGTHVGPDPDTMPASTLDPGPQRPAQVGVQAQGRRLQVIAEQRGQFGRIAGRHAASTRLGSSRGGPPVEVSARSRSSSPNTFGVDRPLARRPAPSGRCCGQDRGQLSPRPVPRAVPPCSVKGTSLPSWAARAAGHAGALSPTACSSPPVPRPRRHCRRPCPATGIDLSMLIATSGDRPHAGPAPGGAPGQMRSSVARHRLLAIDRQRQHVGVAHRHLVQQRHGMKHRGQVGAVVTHVADGQIQAHLAGDTRTVTEPVGTHSEAVLPSDADTATTLSPRTHGCR